jgi:SAM-dependent methyltransferase
VAQKQVFLESEGDAWYRRNREGLARRKFPEEDAIIAELRALPRDSSEPLRILEVGCGEARRLEWVKAHLGARCFGVEPSAEAVRVARSRGVDARQGTADLLPFADASMDVIIFGFCLYLCDREDLSRIASEATRVLKAPGWLLIEDFFSPNLRARPYHHLAGVNSYKMDYRILFDGAAGYVCMTHRVRGHGNTGYTDDPEEWVAVSVLRRLATAT